MYNCSINRSIFNFLQVFRSGQKILDRQRFQYPPNWLYADNVDSEWSAFTEILKRKDSAMQTQVATLQGKIMAEDKAMEQRAVDLLTEWEKGKPVQVILHCSITFFVFIFNVLTYVHMYTI